MAAERQGFASGQACPAALDSQVIHVWEMCELRLAAASLTHRELMKLPYCTITAWPSRSAYLHAEANLSPPEQLSMPSSDFPPGTHH